MSTRHSPTKAQRVRRGLILAVLGVLGAVAWVFLLGPSQLGGPITIAFVHGHSMEPMLHNGDVVVALRKSEYQTGQTVVFEKSGGLVVHRLRKLDRTGAWISRGVNNSWDDGWRVRPEDIKGEFLFTSSAIGSALAWSRNQPQYVALFSVGVFLLLSSWPHRHRLTPQARRLNKLSKPEHTGSARLVSYAGLGMVAVSMMATGMLLMRGQASGPKWYLSLAGLVGCCLAALVASRAATHTTHEPEHTLAVLDDHVRLLPAEVPIDGEEHEVESAEELLEESERYHAPVFHQHLPDRDVFTLVTPEGNATLTVAQHEVDSTV